MRLPTPAISSYVARWAPSMRHLLSSSDVQAWRLDELLALAGPDDLARWGSLDLGYSDSRGDPPLRAEIAGLYATVAPEEVLCFAGIDEAIFVMVSVMAGAGDRIVAVTPAYGSLHAVARAAGAELVLVPLDEDAGLAPAARCAAGGARHADPAGDPQLAPQPHRSAPGCGELPRGAGAGLPGGGARALRRGLSPARARSARPAARGGRRPGARRQPWRPLEGVRAGRPTRRLGGGSRPGPARAGRRDEGLPLRLRRGAEPGARH